MFATEAILNISNIGPGSEIFSIGRFVKHDGTKTNTPIVKFGNISMMPLEPVCIEGGHEQQSFLIEAHSLSGFSSSPVFVYTNYLPSFANEVRHQQLLLGINCGHFPIYERLRTKKGDIFCEAGGENFSVSNAGQMIVVPAWKISEMLAAGPIAERIKEIESESLVSS